MKKYMLHIALLVSLLAISALTACESLTPPQTAPRAATQASGQQTGIWVSGEGEVSAAPDIAVVTLGVEAEADSVAGARDQAAFAIDNVFKSLDSYGIKEKDIKTARYGISPVWQWLKEREENIITGYRVVNTVIVTIREIDNAAAIIDAVTAAAGDNIRISGISFTVDDPTPYQAQAREMAVKDAAAKANQLADAGGIRLGAMTYISESSGVTPYFSSDAKISMGASAEQSIGTSISPGETEIRVNVQIVYEIR